MIKASVRRTALIVGGTSGVGFGVAQSLALHHDLILVFREDTSRAEKVMTDLSEAHPGSRIQLCQFPLVKAEDAQNLIQKVRELRSGGVEILVNAFGDYEDELFLTQSRESIERTLTQQLLLPALLCRYALEDMYRLSFGRIINVGSIGSYYVKRGQVAYSTAKAGLEGLTKALAMEAAARQVTVNLVRPALIQTPSTEAHLAKLTTGDRKLRNIVPVGSWGSPSHVGEMVRYLCSDEAAYVTGTCLTVDGGRSLGDATL